eukprot:4157433-Prymnesium_polylepis.1
MKHCGQRGYHDWLLASPAQLQHCFLHETPMAGDEFAAVFQHVESPHTPKVGLHARYAWATSLLCNNRGHPAYPVSSQRRRHGLSRPPRPCR